MYSHILQKTRTKEEAQILANEVDMLLETVFHANEKDFENALNLQVRSWVSNALQEIWRKGDVDKRVFLQGLKKELAKIRSVEIALAFEPSNAFIDELFSWMHGLVGDYTVLDVSYDPSIIGGFVVTFEGKYGDFSLKKRLGEVFEGKREEIWKLATR